MGDHPGFLVTNPSHTSYIHVFKPTVPHRNRLITSVFEASIGSISNKKK